MSKYARSFFVFLVCGIAIYELPYFLTLRKTGWSSLPPVVDYPADQILYLNLSAIHHASPTDLVNPWYGNIVPAVDVPHLRFPLTYFMFHVMHSLAGSWTAAMLAWAAVWAALTFAAAVFCLKAFLPESPGWLILTGALALLVLQSPLTYVSELLRLPSTSGLLQLWLPFVRFAYPQVVVPAVLVYWGVLSRVLKSASYGSLAAMALMQLFACATFPYVVPIIAAGTAITILIAKRRSPLSWSAISVFALVCGLMDIGYFVLVGLARSHGNLQFALHFRREMILASSRPYVLLLVIASALALMARASLPARATAAGLALANALLSYSDVFFPDSMTLMRSHVYYLLSATMWLPLLLFVLPFLERVKSAVLRTALIGAMVLLGLWEGYASYRLSLPANLYQASAVDELQQLHLSDKDLVIAPAQMSDDLSCSVPLIAPARVLFTRDAENVSSTDYIHGEQNLRQALYLQMGGMNRDAFVSLTTPPKPLSVLNSIAQFGELAYMNSPLAADSRQAQPMIRARLEPFVAELDADPGASAKLLEGYERVIVIDNRNEPFFNPAAFSKWLTVEEKYEKGMTRVWICHSKFAGSRNAG